MQLVGRRLWELEDAGLSFCVWLVALGLVLCPMLWLGSPKDQKWVTSVSVGLVLAVAALTWACVAHAPWPPRRPPPAPLPSLPPLTLQAAALAYGNLVFQFDAHPALLTVQVDMADPRRLGHAIAASYTLSATLALITTLLAGLLRPGSAGRADVLQALPGSPPLYAAVLLATVQILLSTVVGGSALFQDLEQRLRISPDFSWRRAALRVSLLAGAVLLALASPRLPLAMGLLGAAVTGPLSLVLPPLLHARLRSRLHARALPPDDPDDLDGDDAKVLLQPRRSSVEASAEVEAATRAAEAAARGSLVSDSPYRRLADDTQLPQPPAGARAAGVRGALRWLDRRLLLAEGEGEGARPQGPPSRVHTCCCVALAAAGAASSACAFYFAARDAALGVGAGRGPPSCLGLPF